MGSEPIFFTAADTCTCPSAVICAPFLPEEMLALSRRNEVQRFPSWSSLSPAKVNFLGNVRAKHSNTAVLLVQRYCSIIYTGRYLVYITAAPAVMPWRRRAFACWTSWSSKEQPPAPAAMMVLYDRSSVCTLHLYPFDHISRYALNSILFYPRYLFGMYALLATFLILHHILQNSCRLFSLFS